MDADHSRELTFAGIVLLANRMQTTYDAQLTELTFKQWLALIVIARLEQPVASTAVVADALGVTHQNTRKLILALADKGFVRLVPAAGDKRAKEIHLTAAAQDFFTRHANLGVQLLDDFFAGVSAAELATCLTVLNTASRNLVGAPLGPAAHRD